MNKANDVLNLIARIFIAALFFMAGVMHAMDMAEFIPSVAMIFQGAAPVMAWVAVISLFLGSLSVLVGWKARWGAWLLIIFMTFATATLFLVPADSGMQANFTSLMGVMTILRQLIMVGALLLIAANGAGAYSLDKK